MRGRTCLVTKQKAPQEAFFRFTIQKGQLCFDRAKKNPGRGGYVVKTVAAVEKLPRLEAKVKHFMKVKTATVSATEIDYARALLTEPSPSPESGRNIW